jgi:hypothetical protein
MPVDQAEEGTVVLQAHEDGPGKRPTCRGFITELIARCARGDEEALGRIVDLLQPLVLATAGQRFPDRRADDVAVEAFVRVWHQARTYDGGSVGPVRWVLQQVCEPAQAGVPSLSGDRA